MQANGGEGEKEGGRESIIAACNTSHLIAT